MRWNASLDTVELTSAKTLFLSSMSQLDDHVIVITGASSGLGAQLARAVAHAGGTPVLAARRADRLAALTEEIRGADAVTCDVTDEADRERLMDGVIERHDRLDGLINNAGLGATGPALRTSVDTFAQVLDLNLVAPYALSCLAAERMRNGGGRSIVNVASLMGLRSIGVIPDAAYVASKAGLIGLTRELASQWGRYKIRVNAVAPGFFATEMNTELGSDPEQFPDFLLSRTPLGRAPGRRSSHRSRWLFPQPDAGEFSTIESEEGRHLPRYGPEDPAYNDRRMRYLEQYRDRTDRPVAAQRNYDYRMMNTRSRRGATPSQVSRCRRRPPSGARGSVRPRPVPGPA